MSQLIDYDRIPMASDTLKKVAPDVDKHPLLWGPVLANMATYREVFIDDVYDLVDLARMNAARQYMHAIEAYNQHVIKTEQAQAAANNANK